MNTIIDKIERLNHHGVKMMAIGDDWKARKSLMGAILIATKLLDKNKTITRISTARTIKKQTQSTIRSTTRKFVSKTQQILSTGIPLPTIDSDVSTNSFSSPCECTEIELESTSDGGFYTYNRAIIFHASPVSESDISTANVDLFFYSAIIMFNLALCHHRRGVRIGKNILLRKGLVLYSKCVLLMKRYLRYVGGTHFILVSACNNQAHICLEHADGAKFHACLSEVKKYMRNHSRILEFKNELFLNILMSSRLFCTAPSA